MKRSCIHFVCMGLIDTPFSLSRIGSLLGPVNPMTWTPVITAGTNPPTTTYIVPAGWVPPFDLSAASLQPDQSLPGQPLLGFTSLVPTLLPDLTTPQPAQPFMGFPTAVPADDSTVLAAVVNLLTANAGNPAMSEVCDHVMQIDKWVGDAS